MTTRVTVIPSDCLCIVDGLSATGVDMSSLPTNLHAMQWYGEWGEEEYIDPTTRKMLENTRITSLDNYADVLVSFAERLEAKRREEQEAAERERMELEEAEKQFTAEINAT
jgi:hypothetical protein